MGRGSCINWIITNSHYVNNSGTLDDLLSDHSFNLLLGKEREWIDKVWRKVRIYKNYDENYSHYLLIT